jgi:hypothetical protein
MNHPTCNPAGETHHPRKSPKILNGLHDPDDMQTQEQCGAHARSTVRKDSGSRDNCGRGRGNRRWTVGGGRKGELRSLFLATSNLEQRQGCADARLARKSRTSLEVCLPYFARLCRRTAREEISWRAQHRYTSKYNPAILYSTTVLRAQHRYTSSSPRPILVSRQLQDLQNTKVNSRHWTPDPGHVHGTNVPPPRTLRGRAP